MDIFDIIYFPVEIIVSSSNTKGIRTEIVAFIKEGNVNLDFAIISVKINCCKTIRFLVVKRIILR